MDSYFFRAFDIETGRELWKHRLPAGGQATSDDLSRGAATSDSSIVIAAGGHGVLNTPRGDYVIAFTLPAARRPGS